MVMESLRGHLLVASPHLPDPNFSKSVILLVEHSNEGAVGLVLNRVANTSLSELWRQVDQGPCQCDDQVLLGGPVQGPVMCLHGHMEFSESEVISGVYVSTEAENLQQLVQKNKQPFRMFLGYSGWGPGQLESELKVGGWLVALGDDEIVFADDVDEIWQRVIHQAGRQILRDTLQIKDFPDPSCN
jgi:putative transcriptional regulator